MPSDLDPIVAVATAPGRGAVGIVRVSGRGLRPLAQALFVQERGVGGAPRLQRPAAQGLRQGPQAAARHPHDAHRT
ncbi:MAG: hypothetical protein ACKOGB_07805, partial [Betaproteobacteria bacterium]